MILKYFKSSKGLNLMGVMIISVILLLMILGFSRVIINFSEQTKTATQKRLITDIQKNALNLLRSRKAWRSSVARNANRIPGRTVPLSLYYHTDPNIAQGAYNTQAVRWVCPIQDQTHGIAFFDLNGTILTGVNCVQCTSQPFCGVDMSRHVAANISVPSGAGNTSTSDYPPDFSISISDTTHLKSISQNKTSQSADLGNIFDPETLSCPSGTFISNISPSGDVSCSQFRVGGSCGRGQVLVGVSPQGLPICTAGNFINSTCPGHTPLKGYMANGTPICQQISLNGGSCAAGSLSTGFNNRGVPSCSGVPPHSGGMCPGGQLATGIYSNGTPRCSSPPSRAIRFLRTTRASGGSEPQCAHISCPGGWVAYAWGAWVTGNDIRRCHLDCALLGF